MAPILRSLTTALSVLFLLPSEAYSAELHSRATNNSKVYETRFDGVTFDFDTRRLTTTELDQGHYQSRASIANGYIGINVAALGPFFEVDTAVDGDLVNGWPEFQRRQTFATVGGFWTSQPTTNESNYPWLDQYGWDTAIAGVPHWGGIVIDIGGSTFLSAATNASQISNFSSTFDMKQSLLTYAYSWSPSRNSSFNVTYEIFAHKVNVNHGYVRLNITARDDTNVTIANVLNGDCAVRTVPGSKGVDSGIIYTSVQPRGVRNVTAYVYAGMTVDGADVQSIEQGTWHRPYVGNNKSSIATGLHVGLTGGQSASFSKFVGIASSDAFERPQAVAREAALAARSAGFQEGFITHVAEWAELFPSTSVDDYADPENGTLPDDPYIIEAAIVAVVNPYYLLQNTISESAINTTGTPNINTHSIAVGGLGSDSYAGQIFWDAETWMQPGLIATFPYAASGIANYRVARYPQAQANIDTAYQSSKNNTNFTSAAAIYPWTSGRYGNCTATGPCWDYEYHINGDIAHAFTNHWIASGDTEYFRKSLFPIQESISHLFSQVLERNGSHYALTNMTDPDEFANHVDNGGFTMPLISNTLRDTNFYLSLFDSKPLPLFTNQSANILLSRDADANVLLEYTSMNGTISVKQADVVLVTYPLAYTQNYTTTNSISDLDYYASRQSQDGPGMTYAIFSIVANTVSPSGCSAYTYQQYSTQPYLRGPWFQFSEQLSDDYATNGGFHPAFPFLTGHGGANQVALYGYLGLRYIPDSWSLHINPALPPQIPQLRYRTFYYRGHPISAYSNATHTTLTRNSSLPIDAGAVPNTTYTTSPIPVIVGSLYSPSSQKTYSLPPNGSITVPNRLYSTNLTTPNNAAQCLPVTSTSDFVAGQFPISAVDGTRSTKWQPIAANETSSITISFPESQIGQRVVGLGFDWADAPPYNFSVKFHNASDGEGVIVRQRNISISYPYDEGEITSIVPVASNTSYSNLTERVNAQNKIVPDTTGYYLSKYATLSVWGSWYNKTYTRKKMEGEGAKVAEFEVILEGEGGVQKRSTVGEEMGREELDMLGLVGRYNRKRKEKRGGA